MPEQRPRDAAGDSGQAAIAGSLQSPSSNSTDRTDRAPYGGSLGSIFNPLARVLVLLNRPFVVLDRLIVRARRVLHCSRQHHSVAAGVNHAGEMNQNFCPLLGSSGVFSMRDFALNISTRGDQDAVVGYEWKRRPGIDRVALAGIFG